MEMNRMKLEDLCLKICSGGTPLSKKSDYYNPPTIPWLTTSEVNYTRIYSTQKYISEDGLNNSSAKIIPENSVIIAMYGQGKTAGRVAVNKIPLATNQACCNLVINPEIADYQYVYYALSAMYTDLIVLKSGGAQPNLNTKKIKEFEIPYPDLEVQHKIGKILSAYDDMIDTCKQQIALLEEAAQRLYREWFVDMRFPGHETTPIGENGLPEGWKRTTIFPFCTTVLGGTPSRKNADFWGGKIPWINSGAVNQNRIIEPTEYITEVAIARSATKLMPKHTTLLAITGATLGQVSFTEIPVCGNQSIIGVIPPETEYEEFIHLTILNEIDTIISPAGGSAQQHINKDMLNKYAIIVPNKEIILKFKEVINPYYQMVSDIYGKLQGCRLLKDMLLPRLISGQIKINA